MTVMLRARTVIQKLVLPGGAASTTSGVRCLLAFTARRHHLDIFITEVYMTAKPLCLFLLQAAGLLTSNC